MNPTAQEQDGPLSAQMINSIRSSSIVSAVIGIILGIIALVWPGPTLLTVAWLFGVSVIVSGLFRIFVAFGASSMATGSRWLMGILGVLVVAAGVICLLHPVSTLVFIAIFIGIGWIFEGIHDVMAGLSGMTVGPRWLSIVGGLISIVAGIVVFFLPGAAIATFVTVGAILLIVVSIAALFSLPAKAKVG